MVGWPFSRAFLMKLWRKVQTKALDLIFGQKDCDESICCEI